MQQSRSNIPALAAVLLPLASNAGTVSLKVKDADKNVEAVFLDYDKTLTVDDSFTEILRDEACLGAAYPDCDCDDTEYYCDDTDLLTEIMDTGAFSFSDLVTSYGGEDRMIALGETINTLRQADGMQGVYLVSTSWAPWTAAQWKHFLVAITSALGMGFSEDEIITLEDPGPGISADKGGAIQEVMDNIGVSFDEAIFVDNSATNIDTAELVCNTLWLEAGAGITDTDMTYLEILAKANFPLGQPEVTCPPEVETTTAPTGIVYSDKACGSRTYIGKAVDVETCSEMVVNDARCTNKDYFMHRAANAACNCVGAADDCSGDLHNVAGVHIYSVSAFADSS